MIIFRLFWESLVMAFHTFRGNKLRSSLTLLGITIGIFAIISVFTAVDSLEINIRESVSSLGDNVVYIQKWPWAPEDGEEYAWWKYANRPLVTIQENEFIKKNSKLAENTCIVANTSQTIKYKNNNANDVSVMGVSDGFQDIRSFDIESGRYFSPLEVSGSNNVAVLGADLAEDLFEEADPIGEEIKLGGFKVTVIGVLLKEGQGPMGNADETVILPLNFMRNMVDIRKEQANPAIWAEAKEGVTVEELTDELTALFRSIRRLKPLDENNFALNQTSLINNQLDQVFKVINIAGFFIGIFSILVGGFGIANIMFVSVKERTHIIGIEKALGAKNYFILMEFLIESIILSLMGGIVGLLIIGMLTLGVNLASENFTMYLTMGNIVLGIGLSSAIGLVSGFAPAWQAARMNPVVAINTSF
ncbi:MAG: ABC transporter permease [Bacteroidales bacterium]|jgi:putative ABC transport system permease protein|nr:ABC transporter permease [Bacteroidales bacterium]